MSQELNHIYKMLTENQNDQHYRNKVLSRENELYQNMVGFLQKRNYECSNKLNIGE